LEEWHAVITGTRVTSPEISPPLRLSAPRVLGRELDAPVLRRQRERWLTNEWPSRTIRVLEYDNAVVHARGLAIAMDGSVIPETAAGHGKEAIDRALASHPDLKTSAPFLAGAHVLAVRPGVTCYGHVLGEMLPGAWIAGRNRDPDFGVLVAHVPGGIDHIHSHVLAALGIGDDRITRTNDPVRVEKLLVVQGFAETDNYLSPLIRNFAGELAATVPDASAAPRRLFLPRRAEHGRGIANEAEVRSVLSEFGFESVHPEDVSIEDQIQLFRHATHVVGTLGSSLTNLMFSDGGVHVLALAPEPMVDTFFWRLCGAMGHEYSELRSPTTPSTKSVQTGRLLDEDIIVDAALLRNWLLESTQLDAPALP
jgi:hypothetical protein